MPERQPEDVAEDEVMDDPALPRRLPPSATATIKRMMIAKNTCYQRASGAQLLLGVGLLAAWPLRLAAQQPAAGQPI